MTEERGYCKACGDIVVRYTHLPPEPGTEYFHHIWDAEEGQCALLKSCCIPPDQVTLTKEDEDLPLEMVSDV